MYDFEARQGEEADVIGGKHQNVGKTESERKGERRKMSAMLEKILSDENVEAAKHRICSNKGAAGVDGVTVQELDHYMEENWQSIKAQIRERKYRPQPVQRVEIPKPNGGVRKLGIPTVIDRVIEQAITQVLMPIFEPIFSENSYGFRPGRKAEQAILHVLGLLNDGYLWIVDIDLEKFFDNDSLAAAAELLVLHCVENLLKTLLVALLRVLLNQQTTFGGFNTRQNRCHRRQRTAHCDKSPHDANVHGHGCLGAQDAAQHRHARLGKDVGQMPVTAPT